MAKKIGIIVNPVAGMGGKVGLKGSDGEEILAKAIELGAKPECPDKAIVAISQIKQFDDDILEIYTYPNEMGENEVRACGLEPIVINHMHSSNTKPEDTIRAAKEMYEIGVELILFAGGDGTARNILDAVGDRITVLGIPGGCKIHSAVYAINPKTAGKLVLKFLQGKVKDLRLSEVMDIDEDAFREGVVNARLYGYMKVPYDTKMVQNLKSGRATGEEAALDLVSRYIALNMEKDVLYIMGTGSTVRGVMDKLKLRNTLLGVDLVCNNQVIANDVNENTILSYLDKYSKAKIVITVIGGQGYLFGRGNQQISHRVIRKVGLDNILIIATKNKMYSLFGQSLLVDTGDEVLNSELSGYARVIVGYDESVMFKVIS
ncbi:putative polyphosphate/ATP-dependent NAD kinase [Sedimentibacter saalensis]|uniref:Putative polyphosphate/ATP-dependent NAD kinase n=2 Tax=Sedimentibacter saalensis TaxID=130788 RepID=A0A562JKE0_9FIRM|nr:putative polyphosphate/ATP-dependent NAD kinase [Sedimentibacter saalensis]